MSTAYRSRAGLIASLGLAIPVATTLTYMATLGGPEAAGYGPGYQGFEAYVTERGKDIITVWTIESVGFIICAIAAFGLASERGAERASWHAVALGSLAGFVSTAMGISLFPGFGIAGEDHFPLFLSILNSSFYFFFVGKALTAAGVAGLSFHLVRHGGVLAKGLGVMGTIAGVIGLGANIIASTTGLAMVMQAGFSGVVATAIGGLVAFITTRTPPDSSGA